MLKNRNKRKLFVLVLFIVSCVVAFIWFYDKSLIAGGESGIVFHNIRRSLTLYRFPWYETGGGFPGRLFMTFAPPLFLFGFFEYLGFANYLLQASMFACVFFVGMYFVYKTVLLIFPNEKNIRYAGLAAALFYLLNAYSMIQIWGRNLYTQFYAFPLLPALVFFYLRFLLNPQQKANILLFCTLIIIFSPAFAFPSFTLCVWFLLSLITLYFLIHNKSKTKVLGAYFVFLALYVVLNLYWIIPFFNLQQELYTADALPQKQLDSLRSVSQYFPNSSILTLRQEFFLGKASRFEAFYSSIFIKALQLMIFAITSVGLVASRKSKYWRLLIIVAFVAWFISKGTNRPLGYTFYEFLFNQNSVFHILRNSYEKFGIVWMYVYSLFYGYGVFYILRKFKKIKKVLFGVVLILSCGIAVWPMWSGQIMSNKKVKIPSYYEEINSYLEQNYSHDDKRLIHLPSPTGDGVVYTWGYNGVEPSEYLFSKQSISKTIGIGQFDQKYKEFAKLDYLDPAFAQALSELHIGYVVLHKDISLDTSWNQYEKARQFLDTSDLFHFLKEAGDLRLYQYEGNTSLFFSPDPVKLSYTKHSPSNYKVSVRDANTAPFTLIFKSSYHSNWQAKIDGQVQSNHGSVYNYANSWTIDKSGDFDIDIYLKVWPWQ